MSSIGDLVLVDADSATIEAAIATFGHIEILFGNVLIRNTTITAAQAHRLLMSMVRVDGFVTIDGNNHLQTLPGPLQLQSIASFLSIANNDALVNVQGLASMTTIGGALSVVNNQNLRTLCGVNSVTVSSVVVSDNPSLRSAPLFIQTAVPSLPTLHNCDDGAFDALSVLTVTTHPTLGVCFRGSTGAALATNPTTSGATRMVFSVSVPMGESGYIFSKADGVGQRYAGVFVRGNGQIAYYYRCAGDTTQYFVQWNLHPVVTDSTTHTVAVRWTAASVVTVASIATLATGATVVNAVTVVTVATVACVGNVVTAVTVASVVTVVTACAPPYNPVLRTSHRCTVVVAQHHATLQVV